MKGYEHLDDSLKHLSGEALLANLSALTGRDRSSLALLPAHLAEVDERRLHLPAACASMFEYCVRELRLSEDEADRAFGAGFMHEQRSRAATRRGAAVTSGSISRCSPPARSPAPA